MKYGFIVVTLLAMLNLDAATVTFDVKAASNQGVKTTETLSQIRTELGQTVLIEKDNFEAQITATEHQKPSAATNGRTALKLESKILDKSTGQTTLVKSQKVITLSGEPVNFTYTNALGENINLTINPVSVK